MRLSDDLVHRGASAPISYRCVGGRIDLGCERRMILSEIENSQCKGCHHHRSRRRSHRRCHGTFQPMAGGGASCCLKTSPNGVTPKPELPIWRVRRTDGAPNRAQFPRRDRKTSVGGSASCRPVVGVAVCRTSIRFSRSTTTLGHPAATSCCARSPTGYAKCCAGGFRGAFRRRRFVVFQQNIKSNEGRRGLARRIVEHLSERYKIDNHLVEIGASVGSR